MKISLLKPKHAERAANVLVDAFQNDPYSWSRALGRSSDLFKYYMEKIYVPQVVEDSTPSLVAIHEEGAIGELDGGRLVGVLTLEDFKKSDKPSEDVDEATQPIPAILRAAHTLFWSELAVRRKETSETAGNICYFAFLAVDGAYRRKHIGDTLVLRGMEEAKRCGFRVAVAFCTSPKSSNLFARVGFERWASIIYSEFKLPSDGSIPFHSLPDSTDIMVKMLDDVSKT
jgi:ribosomal protein S18 acetylase RimI-like enzyme